MHLIPEDLRNAEQDAEINISSRVIKRGASRQVINTVLGNVVPPCTPILEIGSGTGELYRLLDEQYIAEYTGIDTNSRYIAFNRADNPDVKLIHGDASKLTVEGNSQQTVLALNVLDVVQNFSRTIGEVKRVLKPGGHLVHFHDRRPNLGFLIRHLPKEFAPFPFINTDGFFDRFRLIPRDEFKRYSGRATNMEIEWLRLADQAPQTLEIISFFEPRLVAFTADQIGNEFGTANPDDTLVTPPFKKLFTLMVSNALEMAGMKVKVAETQTAETLAPDEEIHKLIAHSPLRPPYINGNVFVIDENAHYHFADKDKRDGVPKGYTLVKSALNVIMAAKLS